MTRLEDDNPFKTDPAVEAEAAARLGRYRREAAEWRKRDERVTFWVRFIFGALLGAFLGLIAAMRLSMGDVDSLWPFVVLPIVLAVVVGLVVAKGSDRLPESNFTDTVNAFWRWWL